VAIAAELALLFLFHRTSAAIEVLILIIARENGDTGSFWAGTSGRSSRIGRSGNRVVLLLAWKIESTVARFNQVAYRAAMSLHRRRWSSGWLGSP
jgi:hypothetical protein